MSLYLGETKIGHVVVDSQVVQGTDTSDATLSSNDQLPSGVTAYAGGQKYIGTQPVDPVVSVRNGAVNIPNGFYSEPQRVVVPHESEPIELQSKSVTPTTSTQSVTADPGYDGLSSVSVGAIPSEYIVPDGTISITSNGAVDVAQYASASVAVPTGGGTPTLQSKTVTPTESIQTITADSGYDGLSSVEVGAISSTYVGSGITTRSSSDLTASGATVSVPAGYYSDAASKSVASGTAGTPTASKGTVSNHAVTVTPSVTNTTGYITGGTINGAGVSVAASELVSGTKSISANGTGIDVTNYASVDVAVPAPTPNLQAKNATPTESQQTISPDANYDGLSSVTVGAISSTYVGSGITQRDETDLSASGATVTVPAGYYAENESKSVASGAAGTPSATKGTVSGNSVSVTPSVTNTAGYISGGTKTGTAVTVSASELVSGTKTITGSGTTDVTNYASASVAAGTATAPSTISGTSATVSTGTNTLTLTKTVSITPNVSTAGYISSGTAGNASVSLTASVTTKAAATITPGTSNQTIAAGTYLTGAQTIAGDADLVGSNILSTANIFGVQGSVVIQHYYTGSSAPSSSLGSNGDIYLQTS